MLDERQVQTQRALPRPARADRLRGPRVRAARAASSSGRAELTLPLFPTLSEEDQDRVVSALADGVEQPRSRGGRNRRLSHGHGHPGHGPDACRGDHRTEPGAGADRPHLRGAALVRRGRGRLPRHDLDAGDAAARRRCCSSASIGYSRARGRRAPRSSAVLLLAGYAALDAALGLWAGQEELAWDGGNRTLLYALILALCTLWPLRGGRPRPSLGGLRACDRGDRAGRSCCAASRADRAIQYFCEAPLRGAGRLRQRQRRALDAGVAPLRDPGRTARDTGAAARPLPRGRVPAGRRRAARPEPRLADRPAGGRRGRDPGRPGPRAHDRAFAAGGPRAADRAQAAARRLRATGTRTSRSATPTTTPCGCCCSRASCSFVLGTAAALARSPGRSRRARPRAGSAPWLVAAVIALGCVGFAGLLRWSKADPGHRGLRRLGRLQAGRRRPQRGYSASRFSGSVSTYRYDYWLRRLERVQGGPAAGRGRGQLRSRLRATARATQTPRFPHSTCLVPSRKRA